MIDKITIDQVMDRIDILQVVSQFIQLKPAGSNYIAPCPFHKENTASFVVSPSKNIWHCFGCGRGGSAIDFVMEHEGYNYPEAIKWLCKQFNVDYRETNDFTEKEKEEYRKKESLYIITAAAADFYAKQIHKNSAKCKAALGYVNQRWNRRFVDTKTHKNTANDFHKDYATIIGIGYAEGWTSFYEYGTNVMHFSVKNMLDAGLIAKKKDGTYYDRFAERITIPIRDRYRHVIGFTCRTMVEGEGIAKYINSPNTDIYHKSSSIFGIDNAARQAASEKCLYLVEGAPDAMKLHLLGIENAIACLGTAWTDNMLQQLKRYNATLCFIPDVEKSKTPDGTTPGFSSVFKAGRRAVEMGFTVTVKEIPLPEDSDKEDADSYFETKEIFNAIQQQDFVEWYASKVYKREGSTSDNIERMKDICSIIAYIKDEFLQNSLVEKLGNRYTYKNRWKTALKEVKDNIQKKKNEALSKKSAVDLMQYGFIEDNNAYYGIGQGGNRKWSNFKMVPLFHIKDSFNAKRIYTITNEFGDTEILEMKTEELISLPKFKQHVESLGNYIWEATIDELNKMKQYLYNETETAIELTQLGWNRRGFWAWGNGIYYQKEFYPIDKNGIVRLQMPDDDGRLQQCNFYLPALSQIYEYEEDLFQYERKFIYRDDHATINMTDYCRLLSDVFNDNGKIAIEFLLACIFRDIIKSSTKTFPILNLFGPKGSGKSEVAHAIMSFFIPRQLDNPASIKNSTLAAMSDALAQCSNTVVNFEEYKNDIDTKAVELLKGIYDGYGRTRMNMDKDKRRENTKVDSGAIIAGQEMPTVDIALFSRTIFLIFDNAVHTREQKLHYAILEPIMNAGVTHLTNEILNHREFFASQFSLLYKATLKEIEEDDEEIKDVEDRIFKDWTIILTAYRCLKDVLKLPWTYEDMKALTIDGIKRQNKECNDSNEIGTFWRMVEFMMNEGMIFNDADFKIKNIRDLKTDKREYHFEEDFPVLMIRPGHIIQKFQEAANRTNQKTISERSIRIYLKSAPGLLGKKSGSERFKVIIKGELQQKLLGEGQANAHFVPLEQTDNPLCFDYELVKEKYGINLELDLFSMNNADIK